MHATLPAHRPSLTGFLPVWRRNFLVWRKLALPSILGNLADPLIYMLGLGYGLGAMAMTAGGFHAPLFTAAWPTGEFGAMGLEGAVRLGFKKELQAVPEGAQRQALYDQLVARQYDNGSALNMATTLEIDAVIDPAATRDWLVAGLQSAPAVAAGGGPIDTW